MVITDLVVETIALVLDHLPLLTRRVEVRLPLLKDKAEARAFGLVWRRAVWARISTTEQRNPEHNLNQRLGIGNGLRWRGRRGGLADLNHNRRLGIVGVRPRGSTIIEVKVPQTWVQ